MWAANPPYKENTAVYTSGLTKVLVIGGSVAHGWDDKSGGGYLKRTFFSTFHDTYIDKTIIGGTSTMLQATAFKGDFQKWLTEYHPSIVVISWGLLDDAKARTPATSFKFYLYQEITQSLAQGAKVYVVTPPVSIVSYGRFKNAEQAYVNDEQAVVTSMHSPSVSFVNVFDQMKQYLVTHGLTVYDFGRNSWHPDSLGHAIAATLLTADLRRTQNSGVIGIGNVTLGSTDPIRLPT